MTTTIYGDHDDNENDDDNHNNDNDNDDDENDDDDEDYDDSAVDDVDDDDAGLQQGDKLINNHTRGVQPRRSETGRVVQGLHRVGVRRHQRLPTDC